MKRLFVLFFLPIGLLRSDLIAQPEAAGLLIYQEPGTSSAEAIDYRSFHRDNPLYSSVTPTSGQRRQVKTGGVIDAFDYPPVTFDVSFPYTARAILAKLQARAKQMPAVRPQLEAAVGKWQRALSVYEQTDQSGLSAQEKVSLPVFAINGQQYTHARLTAATYESAAIAHDLGVARIPIRQLDTSQILRLNSTSKTIQLGTSVLYDKVPEADAKVSSFTGRLRNIGMGLLEFAQRQTGIRADLMSIWLLFLILPALVVILATMNLVQGHKLKKADPSKKNLRR